MTSYQKIKMKAVLYRMPSNDNSLLLHKLDLLSALIAVKKMLTIHNGGKKWHLNKPNVKCAYVSWPAYG